MKPFVDLSAIVLVLLLTKVLKGRLTNVLISYLRMTKAMAMRAMTMVLMMDLRKDFMVMMRSCHTTTLEMTLTNLKQKLTLRLLP